MIYHYTVFVLARKPARKWVEKVVFVRATSNNDAGIQAVDHLVDLGYEVEKITWVRCGQPYVETVEEAG